MDSIRNLKTVGNKEILKIYQVCESSGANNGITALVLIPSTLLLFIIYLTNTVSGYTSVVVFTTLLKKYEPSTSLKWFLHDTKGKKTGGLKF